MIKKYIVCLFGISFSLLVASDFEEQISKEGFPEKYWHRIDLYRNGEARLLCLPNSYIYQEAEWLQDNNVCSVCSLYPYNYIIEHNRIKILNQEIENDSDRYKEIFNELTYQEKNKKGSVNDLNFEIIQKEHSIDVTNTEKEIEKLKKERKKRKLRIIQIGREKEERLGVIDSRIKKNKDHIKNLNREIKQNKFVIQLKANITLSFDEFNNIIRETDVTEKEELRDIMFLQSLIASYLNADKITRDMLNQLSTYQYHILSLGMFFKWYIGLDNDCCLLHDNMHYFIEHSYNFIKKYMKNFFSMVLSGLKCYENYFISTSANSKKSIAAYRVEGLKKISFFLEPFKKNDIFKPIYVKTKEKMAKTIDNMIKKKSVGKIEKE